MNPFFVLSILILTLWIVQKSYRIFPRFVLFRFLPIPFWCYFLPMILTSFHLLPNQSLVYDRIRLDILPLALILILASSDLRALLRLGRLAVVVMLMGSIGVVLGILLAFSFFHTHLPQESWKAAGALAATWTGGSANMLAVQSSLHLPAELLTPLILTDTFLSYLWMAFLIALAGSANQFNQWLDSQNITHHTLIENSVSNISWQKGIIFLFVGIILTYAAIFAGNHLPEMGALFSHATWIILIVTFFGLLCSLTPLRKISEGKIGQIGPQLLLLMLTSIGAQADWKSAASAPWFIAMGFVCLMIHAIILIVAGKTLKAPVAFLAASSQANVGGTVSAPIVAAVYEPTLATVGLLMAILGNVIGTPIGLAVAEVCRKLIL